jgi:hypothetical protein
VLAGFDVSALKPFNDLEVTAIWDHDRTIVEIHSGRDVMAVRLN